MIEQGHEGPRAEEHEADFYVEPAQLRGGDIAGVILALLALAVIGISGYVWLNPHLSAADLPTLLRGKAGSADSKITQSAGSETTAADNAAKDPADSALAETGSCPYCGMFTANSAAHVEAHWSNGSETDHDCWDCTFNWGRQAGLQLEHAQVVDYPTAGDSPQWLEADKAFYLYDTEKLEGSMPPYVAAFADKAAAQAAQGELGGELLDWTALRSRFEDTNG